MRNIRGMLLGAFEKVLYHTLNAFRRDRRRFHWRISKLVKHNSSPDVFPAKPYDDDLDVHF